MISEAYHERLFQKTRHKARHEGRFTTWRNPEVGFYSVVRSSVNVKRFICIRIYGPDWVLFWVGKSPEQSRKRLFARGQSRDDVMVELMLRYDLPC